MSSFNKKDIDLEKKILNETSKVDDVSIKDDEKKILEEHHYIIEAVASTIFSKKKLPPTVDYNDLVSVGVIGLLKAIRGFEEGRQAQFKTYANIRIKGEMLDLIRKEWSSKSPVKFNDFKEKIKNRVAQVVDNHIENQSNMVNPVDLLSVATTSYVLSLDSELSFFDNNIADESERLEDDFQEKAFFSEISEVLSDLAKDERVLIDLFYRKGFSQKEISMQLNQSESTISRMHNRLLSELKGRLKHVYKNC